MKTYRPAHSRCIGSLTTVAVGTMIVAFAWIVLWSILDAFCRLEPRRPRVPIESEAALYGVLAVIGAIGLLFALASLSMLRTRYEIGATEIIIRKGLLWRSTRTVPLREVNRIEVSSGPIQRWLGYGDLHLLTPAYPGFPITLLGIPRAEELCRYLLDRRETLLESDGEERLARAIERLEGRIPKA